MEWETGSNLVQKLYLGLTAQGGKDGGLREVPELLGVMLTQAAAGAGLLGFIVGIGWLLQNGIQTKYEFLLGAWIALEIGFYLFCRLTASRVFKPSTGFPGTEKERNRVLDAALDDENIAGSITGWFLPLNERMPTLSQAREWLAWYGFGQHLKDLDVCQRVELDSRLSGMKNKHNLNFSQLSPCRVPMRFTLDQVYFQHKPFLFYCVVNMIQTVGGLVLRSMGFRHYRAGTSSYWFLEGKQDAEPIVFIHGIGIGLPMYLSKIRQLISIHPGRSVVLLELPSISMVPTTRVLDAKSAVLIVDAIVQRHRLPPFSLVSHSYGTFVASWLLKRRPYLISRVMLIDPVCFALWESTVIRSFLYQPGRGCVEQLVRFFVSGDMFVTHTLARKSNWFDNNLLPEDIRCPTTVFLSRHDFIINAPAIESYLTRCKAKCPALDLSLILKADYTHGSYILNQLGSENLLRKV